MFDARMHIDHIWLFLSMDTVSRHARNSLKMANEENVLVDVSENVIEDKPTPKWKVNKARRRRWSDDETDIFSFSFGLKQNVCNSTHKRGHILDLLITRVDEELLLSSLDIMNNTLSDHAAITCKLEMPRPPPSKRNLTFRKLRNIDMDSFRSGRS